MATRSELFSYYTCLHATTFILPSIFSQVERISLKIWERPLSWHAKCSLPVSFGASKTWLNCKSCLLSTATLPVVQTKPTEKFESYEITMVLYLFTKHWHLLLIGQRYGWHWFSRYKQSKVSDNPKRQTWWNGLVDGMAH